MSPNIFDATAAAKARDASIAQVEQAAPDAWKAAAFVAITSLARRCAEFTTDDVWRALQGVACDVEPRAMGAVMRMASADGLIEPTDRYVQSVRVACHRRPLRVWRRLVCR